MTDYKQGLFDGADILAVELLKALATIERDRELCSERGYYSQTLTFEQFRDLVRTGLKTQGVISGSFRGSNVETPGDR